MNETIKRVRRFVEENREEILADLCALCSVNSVAVNGADGFRFGKGVDDALVTAEKICEKHGVFCTVNHENGYAFSNSGDGQKTIGFFSHCDVVPATESEWIKTSPFTPYFDGEWLYCRGSEDNKAAAIGGIYISKMVNSGILPLKSRFMCYFGGNEECGMSDIESFIQNERVPELSFVPDNAYPVCVGEKGIARFVAEAETEFKTVTKFDGGTVVNAVIGTLEAEIEYDKQLFCELCNMADQDKRFAVSEGDGKIFLTAHGRSTHAAHPETGENAAVLAARLLCSCDSFNEDDKKILLSLCSLCEDHFGKGVGIYSEDENFGKNTFVVGIARCREKHGYFEFDSRFGRGIPTQEVLSSVRSAFEREGLSFSIKEVKDCFVTKTDEKLIKAYLSAFAKIGELDEEKLVPHYSAGGTYARYLPSSLGLSIHNYAGLNVPESMIPDGHGGAHQADERIFFEAFLNGIVTDAMLIYELDKLM